MPNQVDKSLQTTRRFDALKLWLTLRMLGADGVGALFDPVVDLAAEAYELLDADPRFEVRRAPAALARSCSATSRRRDRDCDAQPPRARGAAGLGRGGGRGHQGRRPPVPEVHAAQPRTRRHDWPPC